MITAERLKQIEDILNIQFESYLISNNIQNIEWCLNDTDFVTAKLMSIQEDDRIEYSDVHNKLEKIWNSSGLSNKPNGKILVSNFSLGSAMYDPMDVKAKPLHSLLVRYQYTYDKAAPKVKRNILDRY